MQTPDSIEYGMDGKAVNGRPSSGSPPPSASIQSRVFDWREAGKAEEDALEAALQKLGPFGFYHFYVLVLLCIPNLFSAMYTLNYVFVADQVPFRCIVPECERESPLFWDESAAELLPNSSCRRYQPLLPLPENGTCLREHFHLTETVHCDHFVYENFNTIFSEFNLGCHEVLRTLVGSVRNAALPVALILTGYISDLCGRRTAFCIFSAFAGTMGMVKAMSVTYQMYLATEFFEAALGYGFNSAAYVMVVELARPSLRATFACATGVAYGLGGMLLALVAWAVPYWRHLLLKIHAPALLLPLYWLLINESPRWLHARGRTQEAAAIIRKAARWNKVVLDDEMMRDLENYNPRAQTTSSSPWLSVVKSRGLLCRFAACSWCWIACAFVYYGLTINSVSLTGDKYVNFALNMAMEVVASLLLMMALERFGRKRTIFFAFLLSGITCVIPYFVSHSGTGLGMFFVGKLAITFAFNSMYMFTTELFPTHARSSALAACSLVGRLGSILAPQTPLLSVYVQALLYAVSSLSAALVVLVIPETRRARLPQSVRAAEVLRPAAAAEPQSTAPPAPCPPVLSAHV